MSESLLCRLISVYTIHKTYLSLVQQVKPFPNKPLILRVCSGSLLKTLWEKEKLLVTSNFSFSHSFFSTHLENFSPFSLNLKLSSAKSLSLEESNICLGEEFRVKCYTLAHNYKKGLFRNSLSGNETMFYSFNSLTELSEALSQTVKIML